MLAVLPSTQGHREGLRPPRLEHWVKFPSSAGQGSRGRSVVACSEVSEIQVMLGFGKSPRKVFFGIDLVVC